MDLATGEIVEQLATLCFALAILHTFSVKKLAQFARRFPEGSVAENLFHLLGEVEIVFGLWAGIFIALFAIFGSKASAVDYLDRQTLQEPLFVFVIMVMASTKPVITMAESVMVGISRRLPLPRAMAFFVSCLVLGPLLGSVITEPAAMTVTTLLVAQNLFSLKLSEKLRYAILGLLLVNVSIGGTLTPFAAPPVVMVAHKWGWGLGFMLTHFGWRSALAIVTSTLLCAFRFKAEFLKLQLKIQRTAGSKVPAWVMLVHVLFLGAVVGASHHTTLFFGLFLFFVGFVTATREYQHVLKIKEALLVAFFLGGLVVLGTMQSWWLQPLLAKLRDHELYLGGIALTSVTDNAALTYLASLVENLSESARYAIVAGSVVGGGLTVIANAPNPIAFGMLSTYFGKDGISPLQLFVQAMIPTLIAGICFWIF